MDSGLEASTLAQQKSAELQSRGGRQQLFSHTDADNLVAERITELSIHTPNPNPKPDRKDRIMWNTKIKHAAHFQK